MFLFFFTLLNGKSAKENFSILKLILRLFILQFNKFHFSSTMSDVFFSAQTGVLKWKSRCDLRRRGFSHLDHHTSRKICILCLLIIKEWRFTLNSKLHSASHLIHFSAVEICPKGKCLNSTLFLISYCL